MSIPTPPIFNETHRLWMMPEALRIMIMRVYRLELDGELI